MNPTKQYGEPIKGPLPDAPRYLATCRKCGNGGIEAYWVERGMCMGEPDELEHYHCPKCGNEWEH